MEIRGRYNPGDGVEIFEELPVPKRCFISATGANLPYEVEMTAVLEDGRMILQSVTCSARKGERVTGENLRRIPVGAILRLGVLSAVKSLSALVGRDPVVLAKRGPTDETLKVVAAVYRIAYLVGLPPTRAVANQLEVARSTAGRWVQAARRKGFLGPAEPRKSGERPGRRRKPPRGN